MLSFLMATCISQSRFSCCISDVASHLAVRVHFPTCFLELARRHLGRCRVHVEPTGNFHSLVRQDRGTPKSLRSHNQSNSFEIRSNRIRVPLGVARSCSIFVWFVGRLSETLPHHNVEQLVSLFVASFKAEWICRVYAQGVLPGQVYRRPRQSISVAER